MITTKDVYFAFSNAAILLISLVLIGGIASLIRTFSIRAYTLAFGGKTAKFVDNRLTFLGVIHHELSHAILAILTGAKITSCKLFQIKNGTLGHVDIQPRGPLIIRLFQQAMCGVAPVLCGATTLYLLYYYIMSNSPIQINEVTIILVVLAMQISYHMSMSSQDLKVARAGMIIVYLIIAIVSLFIQVDYKIYAYYIITIFCIMCINLVIAVIIRIISCIKR